MSRFKPATREQIKLRMAIDGPSGSGKTATANRCAKALGARIAVIDTESGSARKYVGEDFGEGPIQFEVNELTSFSPSEYTAAIEEAGRLGFEVLIIDSLSHAWEGKDGALELKDKKGGNSFTAWKDITPMHRRMIEAILTSPCHVIATMRSKTEYVLEKNEQGKDVPRKVGVAPIQRAGMEYEFDVYGSMDWSHLMTVTKSRCRAVDGVTVAKPGAAFMAPIIEWLRKGSPAEVRQLAAGVTDEQLHRIAKAIEAAGWSLDRVKKDLPRRAACTELSQLNREQADDLAKFLEAQAKRKTAPAPVDVPATVQERMQAPPPPNGAHETPPTAMPAAAPAASSGPPVELLQQIKDARDELGKRTGRTKEEIADDWKKVLAKRNVDSATKLTEAQARELLSALRHHLGLLDLHDQQHKPPPDAAATRDAVREVTATPPQPEGTFR